MRPQNAADVLVAAEHIVIVVRSRAAIDRLALHHRHMRADRDVVVEIDDVLIEQANAAARDGVTDALWLVGAMHAKISVAAVTVEMERAGA